MNMNSHPGRFLAAVLLATVAALSALAQDASDGASDRVKALEQYFEELRARLYSLDKGFEPEEGASPGTQATPGTEAPRTFGQGRLSGIEGVAFKDEAGQVTLTNRPERYRNQEGYSEVILDYDPVVVPEDYAGKRSPHDYTTDQIVQLVKRCAAKYGLDYKLVLAVIQCESAFDPYAVSAAGACGLMQLMPGTAAEMGIGDIYNPAQNVSGGAQYLAKMLGLFHNDLELALAAYNAGPTVVKRHGAIPPFAETRHYVSNVVAWYNRISRDGWQPEYRRDTKARKSPVSLWAERKYYTIYFKSGLSQPADEVKEHGDYYSVGFKGRAVLVRKEFVAKVVKPS